MSWQNSVDPKRWDNSVTSDAAKTHLPAVAPSKRLGIGFKTSQQAVDWKTLDAIWAAAGEYEILDSAWMNDHLASPHLEHGGSSFEATTAMSGLAHRVPGKWMGHAVLSNTFRHPAMTAKIATTLDHITSGRFILGLGAGWHVGEHESMGIELPPVGERIDRWISAVRVLKALFSADAGGGTGVDMDDTYYRLRGATNEPAPVQSGGPPIWLGGQQPRGLRLAATDGEGWFFPVPERPTALRDFAERLEVLRTELTRARRDPTSFSIATQVKGGGSRVDRRTSLKIAKEMVRLGATHVVIAIPAQNGPTGLRSAVREIAEPLEDFVS